MSVSEIFVELQGFLAAEQDIREEIRKVVQSLEQTAREILTLLQGVHQGAGFQDIPKRCLKAREYFGTVKTHLMSLKTKFPAEQYYRFHEHWRFVLQRLVFLAAFVVYLESETLVTREAVTEILGIEPDREKGFHLDVEDYLSGILILASELVLAPLWCSLPVSSPSVVCAIKGHAARPCKVKFHRVTCIKPD
ncbi:translin isoform X5 [Artibeus jamaicensis]|uniref:translin isoform X5 n=1 Tax=Artibeus jamaicensis TaxID=9417 RepID=UPI00235AD8EF|nr:translin isoform X5 [Artibeus jamaicensis]